MALCVSDIPVGTRMTFRFDGGPVREGEVLHSYGGSLVLRQEPSGEVIQFDAQEAKTIEPMDMLSEKVWLANIAKNRAAFEAMMDRMRASRVAEPA
jgi:hypothetical protein